MTLTNPYSKQITSKDAGIFFGHVDENDVKSACLITSGQSYSQGDQYIQLPSTGRFSGGIINRCPSAYQIKCGNQPVDGVGFALHVVDGDLIIAAPSGKVHIIGESVNIHSTGSGGNINLTSANDINLDCVKINLKASAAINFVSTGVAHFKASNSLFLTAGNVRTSTNASSPLAKPPTNMGPTEIKQTIQKILDFIK